MSAGETDSAGEESQLVYRMACSSIAGIEPMDISIAISDASSTFLQEQEAFVGRVEDADATADLFQHLCMPAMDADHLEMTIPVDQVRANSYMFSKNLCTVENAKHR